MVIGYLEDHNIPTKPASLSFRPSICREVIERLSGKSGCDGATDYAQKISVRVTVTMRGRGVRTAT